jgi:hypothetical protein
MRSQESIFSAESWDKLTNVNHRVFQPERLKTNQPRATPWVNDQKNIAPCKGATERLFIDYAVGANVELFVPAFQAGVPIRSGTQGVALGYVVSVLQADENEVCSMNSRDAERPKTHYDAERRNEVVVAFKEWAVICQALAAQRQSLIIRKGGIAEEGGTFRAEHSEFLLYPTYFHEHRDGVKPEYQDVFDAAERSRPAPGTIAFTHFVRVTDVRYLTDLETALALDPLHAWTSDVIRQRFHYRTPGLFVLMVRVFQLPKPESRIERPEYSGCKTWVTLDKPIATEGSAPVLTNEEFAEQTRLLRRVLDP